MTRLKTTPAFFPRFDEGCRTEPTRSFCKSGWEGLKYRIVTVDSANGPQFLARVPTLNIEALKEAADALFARHTVLNSFIEEKNEQPWIVSRLNSDANVCHFDFTSENTETSRIEAEQAIGEYVWQEFNLSNGPLCKIFSVKFDSNELYIGLVSHHYITDSLSVDVLRRDLIDIYFSVINKTNSQLPRVKIDYRNYLYSINSWMTSGDGQILREFVFNRLRDIGELKYPLKSENVGDTIIYRFRLRDDTTSQIRELAKRFRTTIFIVLLAAQKILIHPYCATDFVSVRIITSGRELPILFNTVGNMADRQFTLTDFSGDPTFSSIVNLVTRSMAMSQRECFVRDDFVIADLRAHRVPTTAPVFNFMPNARLTPPSERRQNDAIGLRIPPPAQLSRGTPNHYYLKMADDGTCLSGNIRYGPFAMPNVPKALEALINLAHCNPNMTLSELGKNIETFSDFHLS